MSKNSEFEDDIAMGCIVAISIFGLISNGLSLYLTRTRSRFRNAFGILCSSFLICNLQAIFVLLTWCTIVLSLKSPILSSPKLFSVRLVGVFLNGAWFGSILMHFLTAINRFFAFVYATRYNQLWSEARTFKIAIIFWTISMVYCTHHLYKNCSLLFNSGSKYRWLHHTSYHGQICAKIDGLVSVTLIISMAFIDFITLLKILAYRRTMRRNTTESTVSDINEKEVLFFKQSCKLGLLYISCAVTYNIPSYLLIDKWMLFISSTIAVLLAHSLDGLIFLVFNRKLICKTNFDGIAPATNFQVNQ
uniref:G-protein coupled receptors family 1 profile domain-containing protein n=1 Tax=Wuchereria bancrofti TaxID=6293 RepID=A0AAF5PS41_WUCBA